jgi:hypothetical protein
MWLSGCGYVGPVLPPSPQLPPAITDLSVVERGDRLQFSFSTPARTTDNLPIEEFAQVDLRIGPMPRPFDLETWSASATKLDVPPPPPAADRRNPAPAPVSYSLPVSNWIGKRVSVAVRTSVRRNDRLSSWSNVVTLNVIPPLQAPEIQAKATPNGVFLSWSPVDASAQYRVSRLNTLTRDTAQLGSSKEPDYLDTTAQYDTPYKYTVIAVKDNAESLPSRPVDIAPKDTFPPSVPASITALAAPNTVEVTWQRSPESDLKGYFLFRSVNNGPFERIGDLVAVPTYSDHAVEHGKAYRYEVSAVDQKNNVSERSAPAEARF